METIHTERHKRLAEFLIAERKKAGIRQVELAKKLKRDQSGSLGSKRAEFLDLAKAIGFDDARVVATLQGNK